VISLINPRALFSPTYLLNLSKAQLAPFDPPTRKLHRRTKHEVDRRNPRGVMAIWNFPKCEVGRSVGRRSVCPQYFLHWSHTPLHYVRNV